MKIDNIAGFPVVNLTQTKENRWGKYEAVDSNLVKSLNARYYVLIYVTGMFNGEDILHASALTGTENVVTLQEMANLVHTHFTKCRLPINYRDIAVVKLVDIRTSTRIDLNAFMERGYKVQSYVPYPLNVYCRELPEVDADGFIRVSNFSGPDAFSAISLLLGYTPIRQDETEERDKWSVRYISRYDDDVCSVWVYANSKSEAIREARNEYHDIKDIVSASKI